MIDFALLADRVLAGGVVSRAEARSLLETSDDDLLPLLDAAFRVRRAHFGRRVKLHVLENAKSGVCPEDCGFCSQSIKFKSDVERYGMESVDELVSAGRAAARSGAVMYCMVTSTRGPNSAELTTICDAVRAIKAEFPSLGVCTSLGILKPGQAEALKSAGVARYNHNLETSPRHFPKIVSTHAFEDRVRTVSAARAAGLEACSGGIIGLGEMREDRVDLAFALAELGVESIPLNFLNPRPNTPLEETPLISPSEALRTLAMFRFVLPSRDLRVAGGREVCLGAMQVLALYPANSIFTNGYLTTGGQSDVVDREMIRAAGFEIAEHFEERASPEFRV